MNPHAKRPLSLISLLRCFRDNSELIARMARREVVGRYQGSMLGVLWSFLNPIFMLCVYTFVFSVVFNARWGQNDDESKFQFAVVLFIGLMVHNLFSEVLNRAPGLILGNVNYVKKVVFPLEILPIVSMAAAVFHFLISLLVLVVVLYLLNGFLYWTLLLLPFVILPLVILTIGLGWFVASLGVFVRDVGQTISIVTTMMLFLAPVFYPITALPEEYHPFIMANPLTFIIEQAREVLIWGHLPNWRGIGIYSIIALVFAWFGYAWFQKTRKGFADVI